MAGAFAGRALLSGANGASTCAVFAYTTFVAVCPGQVSSALLEQTPLGTERHKALRAGQSEIRLPQVHFQRDLARVIFYRREVLISLRRMGSPRTSRDLVFFSAMSSGSTVEHSQRTPCAFHEDQVLQFSNPEFVPCSTDCRFVDTSHEHRMSPSTHAAANVFCKTTRYFEHLMLA